MTASHPILYVLYVVPGLGQVDHFRVYRASGARNV
jgi:hypothetical protein